MRRAIERFSPRRLVGNCDINLGYVGYERHRHCDVEFDEAVFRGVAVGGQRNRATLSSGCLYLLGRFSIPMWSLPFQVERELHLFQPRQMKKFKCIT